MAEDQLAQDAPEGWQFTVLEITQGIYKITGTAIWGSVVQRTSLDADVADQLARCHATAAEINEQIVRKYGRLPVQPSRSID